IEGLMVIEITNSSKKVLFKAIQHFEEPGLQAQLNTLLYEVFDDLDKLEFEKAHRVTGMFGSMQIVQFRSGPYFGTLVADSYTNVGKLHELSDQISSVLEKLVQFELRWNQSS
ncbi:hypothetical protein BB560_002907, partial [Smittium megazygosporum]